MAEQLVPDYEEAGPKRLLGRLHQITPRVPLVTGWVRKERGLELLRQAHERAPEDPLNRVFLAEAIWSTNRDSTGARDLLVPIFAQEPRVERFVEDQAARERARELLDVMTETN